jgi:TatA/E family protein of Tat protein translocase
MPDIGIPELIIVAVIVLLVFGPGKAADLGSSLGKGIREFRKATHDDEPAGATATLASASSPATAGAPESGHAVTPSGARFCTECGAPSGGSQKFCTACGASLLVAR